MSQNNNYPNLVEPGLLSLGCARFHRGDDLRYASSSRLSPQNLPQASVCGCPISSKSSQTSLSDVWLPSQLTRTLSQTLTREYLSISLMQRCALGGDRPRRSALLFNLFSTDCVIKRLYLRCFDVQLSPFYLTTQLHAISPQKAWF